MMSIRSNAKWILLALTLVACQPKPQQPTVIMGPTVDTVGRGGYWTRVRPKPEPQSVRPSPASPAVGGPTLITPPPDGSVQADAAPISPEEKRKRVRKKLEDVNTSISNLRQGLNPEKAILPSKDKGRVLPNDHDPSSTPPVSIPPGQNNPSGLGN